MKYLHVQLSSVVQTIGTQTFTFVFKMKPVHESRKYLLFIFKICWCTLENRFIPPQVSLSGTMHDTYENCKLYVY